jgi:hypothetical protein
LKIVSLQGDDGDDEDIVGSGSSANDKNDGLPAKYSAVDDGRSLS